MTLVLTQDGDLMSEWGMRDFSVLPNKEKALKLIANLSRFYKEKAKTYLYDGRMIAPPSIECETVAYTVGANGRKVKLPAILSSAWEAKDGSRALILVNPDENELECKVNGEKVTVPPLNAIILKLK